jgi:hypothetical protein
MRIVTSPTPIARRDSRIIRRISKSLAADSVPTASKSHWVNSR